MEEKKPKIATFWATFYVIIFYIFHLNKQFQEMVLMKLFKDLEVSQCVCFGLSN